MSFADAELPPAKKRRFFAEPSPIRDAPLGAVDALPQTSPSTGAGDVSSDVAAASSQTTVHHAEDVAPGPAPFDAATLESIVGETIVPAALAALREAAGDNLERGTSAAHYPEPLCTAPLTASHQHVL